MLTSSPMLETFFDTRWSSKSSRNILNKKGDRFSPCLTPTLQLKNWLLPSLVVILDLIVLYVLWMKSKHFPLIPWWVSLRHRPALQTVSNACLKSTKQQNSFFLLDCDISIKLLRINRLSDVEKCFLKPDCEPLIISFLSAILLNLLFIIAVKSFPKLLTCSNVNGR